MRIYQDYTCSVCSMSGTLEGAQHSVVAIVVFYVNMSAHVVQCIKYFPVDISWDFFF